MDLKSRAWADSVYGAKTNSYRYFRKKGHTYVIVIVDLDVLGYRSRPLHDPNSLVIVSVRRTSYKTMDADVMGGILTRDAAPSLTIHTILPPDPRRP